MRRVICDLCRKESEPDAYGQAPLGAGWIQVTPRDESFVVFDYCSTACAVTALSTPAKAKPAVEAVVQ